MAKEASFLSRLCKTCENVTVTLDFDEALSSVVKNAAQCLEAKAGSIRLLDKTGTILEIAATFGLSETYLQKGPVKIAENPVDQMALKGETVQVRDVTKDPRIRYPEEAKREGLRSVLCVPLRCVRRNLGVLRIYSGEEREFTPQEISFIQVLATQSAVVIKNALRYRRMKSLNSIGRTIASHLDIQSILSLISESATHDMSGTGSSILLVNRETGELEVVATHGLSERFVREGPVDMDESIRECMQGKDVIVEDVSKDPRLERAEEARREGIYSVVCVPLKLNKGVIGGLLVYTAYRYEIDEEDLEFLHTLAGFGVVALENARLYRHVKRDYDDLAKDVWKWYDWGEREPRI